MCSFLAHVRTRLAYALHPQVHRDSEGDACHIARPLGVRSARIGTEMRAFLTLGHGSADPLYIPLDHSELADVRTQLRAAQQRLDDHGDPAPSEHEDAGDDSFPNWLDTAGTVTDADDSPMEEGSIGVGFLDPDAEDVETVRVRPGESPLDAIARASRMQAEDAEDAAADEGAGGDEMEHAGEDEGIDGIDGTQIPIGSEDRESDASGTEGEGGSS